MLHSKATKTGDVQEDRNTRQDTLVIGDKPMTDTETTQESLPTWVETRDIDGYEYALDSVHLDRESADAAVESHRKRNMNAQSFHGKYLKADPTAEQVNGLVLAGSSAVYTKPRTDRKKADKPAKKSAKKSTKKSAKKGAKKSAKKGAKKNA